MSNRLQMTPDDRTAYQGLVPEGWHRAETPEAKLFAFGLMRVYEELEGTIDLHIHSGPDFGHRLLDSLEVAAQSKAVKMRAIVLKSHAQSTVERAHHLRRMIGGGLDIFGILCLNPSVGGLNPAAVQMAIKLGAKGVWMPSMWADNHSQYVHRSKTKMGYESLDMVFPPKGLTVFDDNGRLKIEVTEILEMVAEADIMLSTGHLRVDESHALLDEANRVGVKKMLVHTVNYHVLDYPLKELEKLADKGAFLEFGYTSLPNPVWPPDDPARQMSLDGVATVIKTVGAERCVVTSDAGPMASPPQIECIRQWITMLKYKGFSQADIDLMTKHNPARLLGMDPKL